jgi:salicylate hydroxylase
MTEEKRPIVIAGGGPAGLLLSLLLSREERGCIIFDKSNEASIFGNVGGAYDMLPNTLRMFDSLGIGDEFRKSFTQFLGVKVFDDAGLLLRQIPFHDLEVKPVSLPRAELQRFLWKHVNRKYVQLDCDSFVVGFREKGDCVEVDVLCQKSKVVRTVEAELLVGADGINSKVREALLELRSTSPSSPEIASPAGALSLRYSGVMCWWGTVSYDGLSNDAVAMLKQFHSDGMYTVMIGPDISYMGGETNDNNIVWCLMRRMEKFHKSREGIRDRVSEAANLLPGGIQTLVEVTPENCIFETAISDRPPISWWHYGSRAVIIGDAAHSMNPFLGLGANTAMIDAFILWSILGGSSDHTHGYAHCLAAFETRRKAAVEGVAARSYSLRTWAVPDSRWKCFVAKTILSWTPQSLLLREIARGDDVNNIEVELESRL